jgi:hypothetical protein
VTVHYVLENVKKKYNIALGIVIQFKLSFFNYPEIEVDTAMVMNTLIFWFITQCSSLKVGRRFGGTCLLHLNDRTVSKARNQHEEVNNQISSMSELFTYRTH